MFAKGLLYFHTVRYLKPNQIYARLTKGWLASKPPTFMSLSVRFAEQVLVRGPTKPQSILAEDSFRFLNFTDTLGFEGNWQEIGNSDLWRYHLHYFDDLNAVDAHERYHLHQSFIARWMAENPMGSMPAWDPYPTSLRIVNWIKFFYRRQVPEEILKNLYCNLCWLDGRIEWHLMANHLFANAKALVFGGLFMDGSSADKILQHGLEIMDQQIDEQILKDGGHFERSPMYHSIILEDVLDLIAISSAYGLPETDRHVEKWSTVASKMLGWLEALTHPDGCLAHFNDVAQYHAPSANQLVKYAADLGISSAAADQKQAELIELSSTGFIRAKTERFDVMMNVGSVGPAYQPGHAHADTLSFELSVDGLRWFVNTGVSGYGVTADRSYERSSEAHNTVVVDGMDSSEVWSSFRVARRARVRKLETEASRGRISVHATHDGYTRLRSGPIHERSWLVAADRMTIIDKVNKASRPAFAHLLVCPGLNVEQVGDGKFVIRATEGKQVLVEMAGGKLAESYYAPEFGIKTPTWKLTAPLQDRELRTSIQVQNSS